MNIHITNYIDNTPEAQQKIMNTLRRLLHESVANVSEEFKWSRPVFKMKKDFAYMQANKNHVTLGFYSGFEKLKDPNGLLEGTGNTMRHIKIKSVEEINGNLLKEWFMCLTKD